MCNFFRVVLGASFLCHFYSVSVDAASQKNSAKKQWTILVYLNADNNLEDAGYEDIQEMEKVGSTEDTNVVVQFDYINPEGTKRLYIEKYDPTLNPPATSPADENIPSWNSKDGHKIHSTVVEEMPEQDMGDPKVFSDFVTWGMQAYPAEHYMVIMWNHGSGWPKEKEIEKGISYDDTSGNHISTNQLEMALDNIVSTSGHHIDVLAFDACLMGMVEVTAALGGLVDYVVASEETIPWDGYPYDEILNLLGSMSSRSPKEVATMLVSAYGMSYTGGSQGRKDVTLSAIDVSKFEMIERRLDAWVQALKNTGLTSDQLSVSANETQNYSYSENKDLGNFVERVLNQLTMNEAVAALAVMGDASKSSGMSIGAIASGLSLLKAIDETVIANFTSSRYMRSHGLAIYLPAPYRSQYSSIVGDSIWKQNRQIRDQYMNLRWARTTTWTSFLDQLFLN